MQDASQIAISTIDYSICSLVTKWEEYREMVLAFQSVGFSDNCEYIYIDNSSGNSSDAYQSYNRFLQVARGKYLLLCHQDILPGGETRDRLSERLKELTQLDPQWACCGNAGVSENGQAVYRISDPHGMNQKIGNVPGKVMSLDENLIIIRKDANLALSSDLGGFHWYGSDICIIADILGYSSYVIDFPSYHKSPGKTDSVYALTGLKLRDKYRRAFRTRRQHVVTRFPLTLSGYRYPDFQLAMWKAKRKLRDWGVKSIFTRLLRH